MKGLKNLDPADVQTSINADGELSTTTHNPRNILPAVRAFGKALMADLGECGGPNEATHDQVAEAILFAEELGAIAREVRQDMEAGVLAWLHGNSGKLRRVEVGERFWWGELEKKVRCLDSAKTLAALAKAELFTLLAEKLYGDEEAINQVLSQLEGLFRSVLSSNGLRDAAARERLAVAELPDAEHYEETWPEALENGQPKVKLGVAQLRFIHRRPGGEKKELEKLEAGLKP